MPLCLPPVCAAPSGHHTGFGVGGSVVGSRSSAVASEGVVFGSAGFSRGRTTRHSEGFNLARSTSHEEVSPRPRDPLSSHVELIQRIIRNAGFLRNLRKSQRQISRSPRLPFTSPNGPVFLGWCVRRSVDPYKTYP